MTALPLFETEPVSAIAFISSAKPGLEAQDIDWFLVEGRAFCEQHGLTGVSLYCGDQFFHYAEGPRDGLRAAIDRVSSGKLHQPPEILLQTAETQRHFNCWYMGFTDCTKSSAQEQSNIDWQAILPTTRDTPDMSKGIQLVTLYWSKWIAGMR